MSNRDTPSHRTFVKRFATAPVTAHRVERGSGSESHHVECMRLFLPWDAGFVHTHPSVALVAPSEVAPTGPLAEFFAEVEQTSVFGLEPALGELNRMVACDGFVGYSGSFDRESVVETLLLDYTGPREQIGSFAVFWFDDVVIGVGPGVLYEVSGQDRFQNAQVMGQAIGFHQRSSNTSHGPVLSRLFDEVNTDLAAMLTTDPSFAMGYPTLSKFSEHITGVAHDVTQEGDAIRNRAFVLFDDAAAVRPGCVREVLSDVSEFLFQQYHSPTIEFEGELVTMSEVRPAAEATVYSSGT